MRTVTRWLLVVVFVFDALFALAVFSGWLSRVAAASGEPQATEAAPAAAAPEPPPSAETMKRLGQALAERSAELDRREAELEELVRGSEVLRRAGLLPVEKPAEASTAPTAAPPAAPPEGPHAMSAAFEALRKAYENMEADSAARALAELSRRDKQVVIQLLIRWNPRTAGAILDSLAQSDPALAADLSYEVWKSGGGASTVVDAGGSSAP